MALPDFLAGIGCFQIEAPLATPVIISVSADISLVNDDDDSITYFAAGTATSGRATYPLNPATISPNTFCFRRDRCGCPEAQIIANNNDNNFPAPTVFAPQIGADCVATGILGTSVGDDGKIELFVVRAAGGLFVALAANVYSPDADTPDIFFQPNTDGALYTPRTWSEIPGGTVGLTLSGWTGTADFTFTVV